jgi:hypothetical protein
MQATVEPGRVAALEGTRRERAEAEVKAAQVDTTAARDAVAQLEPQLAAAQLQAGDIKLRGAELRLESAGQELKECQQVEARLSEDLARLLNEEALEAEGVEVQRMIGVAKGAYEETVRAAERFEASLVALKTKTWLDPRHKSEASNAVFKLAARCKGFNY